MGLGVLYLEFWRLINEIELDFEGRGNGKKNEEKLRKIRGNLEECEEY